MISHGFMSNASDHSSYEWEGKVEGLYHRQSIKMKLCITPKSIIIGVNIFLHDNVGNSANVGEK